MPYRWKKSWHTLVIFKSSMARKSLNRIIRRKIPMVVKIGREELEIFPNT